VKYPEESLNDIVELSKDTDLIGISVVSPYFKWAVQVTQALKRTLDVPVLWGGIHPTVQPEESLEHADMVCLGEGEEALVELATKMDSGQDFCDVSGMWFKENGKIIKNAMRPLIQNLDTIPLPDNDYADKYLLCGKHILPMNDDRLKKYSGLKKKTYKTLPTRGCLYACTYCCHSALKKLYPNQNYIRKRSIDNIIKELMEVKNADRIKFSDDHFFSYNEEEIEDFCRKYKKSINLPLMILGVSPGAFSRRKLALLVDAGLVYLKVGIQTGSKNTKKLYKRSHSNKRIIQIAKEIHEFGISEVTYDIIIDNPWESDEDLIETLMFLTKLPVPYKLSIFSLRFYPGSAMYEMAKSKGIEEDELKENYNVDFHDLKNNYLNKLFVLMQMYAKKGKVLSPNMMSLLTSQKLRRLKLHWLLFGIMKIKLFVISEGALKNIKKKYKKKIRQRILKPA
jgi:radical SAM superfamily enzyme YgiQ (UPF0313 family)